VSCWGAELQGVTWGVSREGAAARSGPLGKGICPSLPLLKPVEVVMLRGGFGPLSACGRFSFL